MQLWEFSQVLFIAFIYSLNPPEHPWLGWKFEKAPKGYWDDLNNVKTYMQEGKNSRQNR